MHFDLHRPCEKCPFRKDVPGYLSKARAREITRALKAGKTFSCHLTVTHDDDGEYVPSKNEKHCAGALLFLEAQDRPNQLMRIAERIGLYDRTKLADNIPTFATAAEMIKHMRER